MFVPSMALGVLITAPFVTVGLILAGHAPWRLYTKAAAIPGILAGCLWNAGNVGPLSHPTFVPFGACHVWALCQKVSLFPLLLIALAVPGRAAL